MADPATAARAVGARGVGSQEPRTRARGRAGARATGQAGTLSSWWPLAAITLLAAVLRLGTLNLQSFWYDEAFTPVHVLHPGLAATLRAFVHTENTPPLWYILAWGSSRLFGTGEVALRLPSALAGIATVPVAWGIGRELAGRRAALVTAALVAVNPLFVWYSQEARAYACFVLFVALALFCCLRADHRPMADGSASRWLALFALSGALALLSHYFAVFLLIPMALWLLRRRERLRATLPAVAALALVGLALLPLIVAQGGHGTQWIGEWSLSARLEAIPQYYLTGYSAAPLGHGVELLVALAILAGIGLALWRTLTPQESDGALFALALVACGVLLPVLLAAVRRRLPRAAQPRRRDDPAECGDRRDRRRAALRARRHGARRPDYRRVPRAQRRRRPQPAPATRRLARSRAGAGRRRRRPRTRDHDRRARRRAAGVLPGAAAQPRAATRSCACARSTRPVTPRCAPTPARHRLPAFASWPARTSTA